MLALPWRFTLCVDVLPEDTACWVPDWVPVVLLEPATVPCVPDAGLNDEPVAISVLLRETVPVGLPVLLPPPLHLVERVLGRSLLPYVVPSL